LLQACLAGAQGVTSVVYSNGWPNDAKAFDGAALAPGAQTLVLRVRVEPDAFYTELYRDLLTSGSARKGRRLIQEALDNSIASQYTLFESRYSVLAPGKKQ